MRNVKRITGVVTGTLVAGVLSAAVVAASTGSSGDSAPELIPLGEGPALTLEEVQEAEPVIPDDGQDNTPSNTDGFQELTPELIEARKAKGDHKDGPDASDLAAYEAARQSGGGSDAPGSGYTPPAPVNTDSTSGGTVEEEQSTEPKRGEYDPSVFDGTPKQHCEYYNTCTYVPAGQ